MITDAAIAAMAQDLSPVRRHAMAWRLMLGMSGGGLVTLGLVVAMLGLRPDLGTALRGFAFWMKWAYTLSLGIVALAITTRLARPEQAGARVFWPLLVPFAVLALVGAAQLAIAPPGAWPAMWLGQSWTLCPVLVLVLSLPIFAGLVWSFRRLAPTQLRSAGAAAGFAAGAWAATLYGLHCPESSAPFVLAWYSLGIGLAAGLGSLLGPRLLRW